MTDSREESHSVKIRRPDIEFSRYPANDFNALIVYDAARSQPDGGSLRERQSIIQALQPPFVPRGFLHSCDLCS